MNVECTADRVDRRERWASRQASEIVKRRSFLPAERGEEGGIIIINNNYEELHPRLVRVSEGASAGWSLEYFRSC